MQCNAFAVSLQLMDVMAKFDQEERELLESFELGQLSPVEDVGALLARHREAAVATIR